MEVQDEKPRVGIPLECVGFRGIRKRILVRGGGGITLVASIDVCVGLPPTQRGAHLSRNYYAILEAVGEAEGDESIESFLSKIASRLIEKHPYATKAVVEASTSYFVDPGIQGPPGEEPVDVRVRVEKAGGRELWTVQVSVYGMTACPSAQQTLREMLGHNLRAGPTHSQKARLTLTVTVSPGPLVRIERLAQAAFRAFSAPARSVLRRSDEAMLVLRAHENPKLAEDVVRDALVQAAVVLESLGYGDDTIISAEVESYESIHPQNVVARAKLTLGELRGLLRGPNRDFGQNH
ncbi:MAG: GTP cyclohydrolase I FolE2 [Desulfurococcales archaeon]|nr:GTP cyclohydrolase I FolE2 [Desulfurococcales archaeon]